MYFYLKKGFSMIITILAVTVITFVSFQIIPGDPVLSRLGVDADQAQIEALKEELNLNKPLATRYFIWLKGVFTGNMGQSFRYSVPVSDLILSRISVTFILALISLLLIIFVGVPLGIISARYNNKIPGLFISFISQIGMAVPSFWTGILLMFLFGIVLKWFSVSGYVSWSENPLLCIKSLTLPAISIAIPNIATVIRYMKNMVLDEMKKEYVKTAYSKGLSTSQVLSRHILKNAIIPVITILGMITATILGGSIIIEQVFSLPGIGRLLINAITTRDIPLVQGIIVYISVMIVIINFIIDIFYTIIDPRIRFN